MMKTGRLRLLTYNVHCCIGRDGQLSPARVAAAIAELQPDVVALQELDVGRARTQYANQTMLIAEALNMNWFFHPAYRAENEHYGDAVLSYHPMKLVRAAHLPTLVNMPHLERRGALWAAIDWNGFAIQLFVTHLGLVARERLLQVDALLSPEWLGSPECQAPFVLCGDLNFVPGTRPYRRLCSVLRDPFPWHRLHVGTFPSGCPVLRIDHVLFSSRWVVHSVSVPRTRLTRIASDHLPLLVEASAT
jgi:endonuclease/exonuclease/phosphatase family metal-dependent hydrolase